MSDALERKLRRLGVVKGVKELRKTPPKPKRQPIVNKSGSLPGREINTEYGTFWLDKREYDAGFEHGTYNFSRMIEVGGQDLSIFGVSDLGSSPAFVDTETTGLAGGAGTIAFLVGIGVWKVDKFIIHLVFIRNPDEEHAAMHYVADVLDHCTGLVTYNGRSFDLPLLQTRFILNRMVPNWLDLPHLDLLMVARRLWRDHLPSRRLGEIEGKILSITRTDEDLPSFLIPFYYRQYLETGDTTQMRKVIYHNVIDILSLVSLLIHVTGVGTVYFKGGSEVQALEAWERAISNQDDMLPDACTSRLCGNMAVFYKRRVMWDKALQIWDVWTSQVPNAVKPLVEKAKYYEWTDSNVMKALDVTEIAISRVERFYDGHSREKIMGDLLHRKHRLEHKLSKDSDN